MPFTFCSSGAIVFKAGKKVDSAAAASGAFMQQVSDEAEQFINMVSRIDYITAYAGLAANKKKILSEAASCLAAILLIQYDMSGYTSRLEAQTMLDVLSSRANACIELLKDSENKRFLGVV